MVVKPTYENGELTLYKGTRKAKAKTKNSSR
jgi:hypothetical protein